MSDGSLSQDEIDALLQGSGSMEFDSGPVTSALSNDQTQAFQRIVSGTTGSQQSNISMLTSGEVQMSIQSVSTTDANRLAGALGGTTVQVSTDLTEGAAGKHSYLMDEAAAIAIAGPMMGQDDVDLDDAALNALQEAFSQVAGPVITALGDAAGVTVMNAPPSSSQGSVDELDLPAGEFVDVAYSLSLGGASYVIHEVFDLPIVQAVTGGAGTQASRQPQQAAAGGGGMNAGAMNMSGGNMGGADTGGMGMPMGGFGGTPNVQSVQFPNLGAGSAGSEQGNIGLLMDVYMEMTVELGRTRKLIKEILGMGEGTIIELDKLAGEPVDILVNHKLIAKGEVVVIDENFGVRVTEIVSPMERMSGMP
ncbi:MAG: flagellar motor switch protein FliN [Spirochaetales bacterium]